MMIMSMASLFLKLLGFDMQVDMLHALPIDVHIFTYHVNFNFLALWHFKNIFRNSPVYYYNCQLQHEAIVSLTDTKISCFR